jgi:hypothetical protein
MLAGDLFDLLFQRFDQIVKCLDHGKIGLNRCAHRRIVKAFCHSAMVELARDVFVESRQIVLDVGVLDMGQQQAALANHIGATSQQIPCGPHFGRIRIGKGQGAAP